MIKFCQDSGIQEVLLFPHGLITFDSDSGFWNDEKLEADLTLLREARDRLHENGIRMGMNIWQTIGHADRDRNMRGRFEFQPLVSDAGHEAQSQACPLCPKWRAYYLRCLEKYAEIKPDSFFYDDDFRFQNHANAKGSGAFNCFCPLHLAAFNRQHGTCYDREGLIRAIVKPGQPHPARRQWLDMLNEQLIDLATECQKTFHAISPLTELGLMSGYSDEMLKEGRDWPRLIRAIAGPGRPLLNRPHYPDYGEFIPGEFTFSLAIYRQSVADLPEEAVPFAEIDNCMPTEYNQSPTHLCLRMVLAALTGTRDFHISANDWNGNKDAFTGHTEYSEAFAKLHESLIPLLGSLKGKPLSHGIQIPMNYRRILGKETMIGDSLSELSVNSVRWAKPLQLAGFPITFEESWAIALTEDVLWGLERSDVEAMLRKVAILDYTAIRWMVNHGCGDLIGVSHLQEFDHGVAQVVAEEIIAEDDPYFGAWFDHNPLVPVSPEFRFTLDPAAIPVTRLRGREGKEFGPGAFTYQNALGGTVFGIPLMPKSLEFNPFLTRYRIAGLRDRFSRLAQENKASYCHIEGQPNVLPIHVQHGSHHLLACMNLRSKTAEKLAFHCHSLPKKWRGFLWQEAECQPLSLEVERGDNDATQIISIPARVAPSAIVVLVSED